MTPDATPPDPLDALFAEWKIEPEVPPSLARDVWAHIGAGNVRPAWWERLAMVLLRPQAIAASVVVSAVTGTALALLLEPTPRQDAHTAYVQSISPFASVHLASR